MNKHRAEMQADSTTMQMSMKQPPNSSQPIFLPLMLVFTITIAAQLVSLAFGRVNEEQSFSSIVLPSLLFLSVLTLPLSAIGIFLGRQIGLGTPLLAALLSNQPGAAKKLQRDIALTVILGFVLGGILLLIRMMSRPYLPPELPAFGYRGVIGGISVSIGAAVAEEVWFRLGLMTILIWSLSWLRGHREVHPLIAWIVIVITSIGFGMAHLPQLTSYGAGSLVAIIGTIAGNSFVGILYGWCYWRRGLIAAISAHFAVDLVLHVFPALVT